MQKMILKAGFLAALITVVALGVTVLSQSAIAKPTPGPITDCPSTICPTNLTGWVWDGTCTTEYEHYCVEECTVRRNTSTNQRCKDTTNCAWW